LIFRSSLVVFCVNPIENINSPKLMETVSNNLLLYSIYTFWSFMEERLTVHGIFNYRQQAPPQLGFYSSSRKGWIT
jgi:hypothetical protein